MSIYDEEKRLFKKWHKDWKDPNSFVGDGVVCETAYLESDPKIAIILKEPHGGNEGDIRKWLRDVKSSDPTWNTVARWVYGIRNRKSRPAWKDFPKTTPEFKTKTLQHICAMNLKKSAGGSSADYSEIEKAAHEEADLIQQQYDLYDPDLTICAGTEKPFWKAMEYEINAGAENNKEIMAWRETKRGVWWYEREPKKYVVSFYHPARPIESTLKLYPLIDAINEIYNP